MPPVVGKGPPRIGTTKLKWNIFHGIIEVSCKNIFPLQATYGIGMIIGEALLYMHAAPLDLSCGLRFRADPHYAPGSHHPPMSPKAVAPIRTASATMKKA